MCIIDKFINRKNKKLIRRTQVSVINQNSVNYINGKLHFKTKQELRR